MKRKRQLLSFSEQEMIEMAFRQKFLSKEEQSIWQEVYGDMKRHFDPHYYYVREQERGFVVLTLGKGVDRLQESYIEKEEYLKAYCVECLGLEFLLKAYDDLKMEVKKEGEYIQQFLYPGEQLPIEAMREIFLRTNPKDVTYNESFFIDPKKSVAMEVILTKEKEKESCGICEQCKNINCTSRKVRRELRGQNYGYQRIFKK